ncbi:hypothetical protein BHE74_00009684 [Ensete ventricosum]|nr:hypothetical protein BHE74_00009684 [Ensete ventricosum]RZR85338.1 hypothetical protein BHM03_00012300 [Ensete ventricosum]
MVAYHGGDSGQCAIIAPSSAAVVAAFPPRDGGSFVLVDLAIAGSRSARAHLPRTLSLADGLLPFLRGSIAREFHVLAGFVVVGACSLRAFVWPLPFHFWLRCRGEQKQDGDRGRGTSGGDGGGGDDTSVDEGAGVPEAVAEHPTGQCSSTDICYLPIVPVMYSDADQRQLFVLISVVHAMLPLRFPNSGIRAKQRGGAASHDQLPCRAGHPRLGCGQGQPVRATPAGTGGCGQPAGSVAARGHTRLQHGARGQP